MKNQYFGDINDYRKYGLIRAILQASGIRMLLAWMLTPDDGSTDGKFVSYLQNPDKWSHHDPFLFNKLKMLLADGSERAVSLIENAGLLANSTYFSEIVPDSAAGRDVWIDSLLAVARQNDFVFLDPDNGLEVKSRPYGSTHSSKYLYWREVEALWGAGKSLLIYQHFIREKRADFIKRMLQSLKESTPDSTVEAFPTSNVVFLMALQPRHLQYHKAIMDTLQRKWRGEIHQRKLGSALPLAKAAATRRLNLVHQHRP